VVHQPESRGRFDPYNLLLFSCNSLRTFSAKFVFFCVDTALEPAVRQRHYSAV